MLNAMCSPGLNATIGVQWVTPQLPQLVIYLDPESVAVQPPPFPDGDLVLSRFLREMSREAAKLATELETRRAGGPPPEEPTLGRLIAAQELTAEEVDRDNRT
jgi:hypothetical protein